MLDHMFALDMDPNTWVARAGSDSQQQGLEMYQLRQSRTEQLMDRVQGLGIGVEGLGFIRKICSLLGPSREYEILSFWDCIGIPSNSPDTKNPVEPTYFIP